MGSRLDPYAIGFSSAAFGKDGSDARPGGRDARPLADFFDCQDCGFPASVTI